MQEDGIYCGASDWAKSISNTVWHSKISPEDREVGCFYDEAEYDWVSWLFEAFGRTPYTKVKQQ